ncbi:hypothetical protein SAMN04488104_10361 [Algoriphagus faecimaris]|uniref:Uncharacterized protein n=1 Tax=Algoriphagus faecimaris TaxID=686796 RepID=A0A1G6VM36_9BACT|nr:hypothetical protein [Algoriphagus faecimaris]SDD53945.1 hypothetical protein SAMN04488104_10361 [Algoriphagus faecimaris]
MEKQLLIILGISWFADFYFYGMQRYVQLISREVEIPFKLGKLVMLPTFYGVTYLLDIIKYGLAIYLSIYYQWDMVLYIVTPIFIITIFMPIPYRKLYQKVIKKTLSDKTLIFPEHIKTIIKIQIESRLLS